MPFGSRCRVLYPTLRSYRPPARSVPQAVTGAGQEARGASASRGTLTAMPTTMNRAATRICKAAHT